MSTILNAAMWESSLTKFATSKQNLSQVATLQDGYLQHTLIPTTEHAHESGINYISECVSRLFLSLCLCTSLCLCSCPSVCVCLSSPSYFLCLFVSVNVSVYVTVFVCVCLYVCTSVCLRARHIACMTLVSFNTLCDACFRVN